jgi:hypothetical protein
VLLQLKEINLKLNLGKYEFARFSLTFLGHVVSHDGAQLDPKKIKAIINFLVPTIVSNVQAILGLKRYYKNYVNGYSRIATPLFDLTKKDVKWNLNYYNVFENLRDALVSTPILVKPNFTKAFILDVDWFTRRVGAILSQKEAKNEHVIAYANKRFSPIHKKFHPMEGECYALGWGIMHFRWHFYHNHFTFRTNHKPLECLLLFQMLMEGEVDELTHSKTLISRSFIKQDLNIPM